MSQRRNCPGCGDELPADFPRNLCPRCLLLEGMGSEARNVLRHGGRSATDFLTATGGGVLASIAATHGPIRSVLLRDTDGGPEPPLLRPGGRDSGSATRYRIDGQIAQGGMGSVLKGRDPDLGRDVAVKVLREELRENVDMVRRFVEEAQIGGQLQHPGIVPIYELGTFSDQRPFFAMKLVKGHTLAGLLDDRATPGDGLPRFLGIFESIAQTVAYAHARGVIHRDLKPSNVMVGSFGEVQVMDWGLAKVLTRGGVVDDAQAGKPVHQETVIATARSGSSDSDLSRAGSVMGTPSYMAPEQARGEIDQVDERADVFALGSILCETLTGEPAFTGRTAGEIQRKAARGDLADAISQLNTCKADADLVSLAKDCLSPEVEDRPRTAGAVADRVTAYLAGVQERLRRAELERVEELARRRLTTVVASALMLFALVVVAGYVWTQQEKAIRIARTARGVDAALADAARLRGEAQAAPAGETFRWAEALSAAKRADALLAQGEADAPLRTRVSALLTQLNSEEATAAEQARRLEIDHVLQSDLEGVRGNRAEHNDPKRTDAEYADAFRKAGLDLDATEPARAGKWIAARSQPVELAGYLDDWTFVRIAAGLPEAAWRRPVSAARAADPDPWRDALRSKVGSKDPAALAECRRLADDAAALEAQPPASLVMLASQLTHSYDDLDRAGRVLRRAARRHPDDFWLQIALADSYGGYTDFTRPEEAMRHFTAAIALRPRSVIARNRLGFLLSTQARADEAIAEFREAIRIQPNLAESYAGIAGAMMRQGRNDEAIPEFRMIIHMKPGHFDAHANLGHALKIQGKLDEADIEFREAIRLRPDDPWPRCELADDLRQRGKFDEAIAECREAIRFAPPDFGDTHCRLAQILEDQGKLEEAYDEYCKAVQNKLPSIVAIGLFADFVIRRREPDEAITVLRDLLRRKPNDAWRYLPLAAALKKWGKPDEAVVVLRDAIPLKSGDLRVRVRIGLMLEELGKLDEAETVNRDLVELARRHYGPGSPGTARAVARLGLTLTKESKWSAAESALRECLEIREKTQPEDWTTSEARSLLGGSLLGQGKFAEAEPLIISGYEGIKARQSKIPNTGKTSLPEAADRVVQLYDSWGKKDKEAEWRARVSPSGPTEQLAFAQTAYDKKRFATAAGLMAEALKADPKLGDDHAAWHRYNAACAATLAVAGLGKDEPPLDVEARARLRSQALDWLNADLASWSKLLESGPPQGQPAIAQALAHWQRDTDLASIRDAESLAKVADAERKRWQALWADVDALAKRAQGKAH